jgi:hypothetical protein
VDINHQRIPYQSPYNGCQILTGGCPNPFSLSGMLDTCGKSRQPCSINLYGFFMQKGILWIPAYNFIFNDIFDINLVLVCISKEVSGGPQDFQTATVFIVKRYLGNGPSSFDPNFYPAVPLSVK